VITRHKSTYSDLCYLTEETGDDDVVEEEEIVEESESTKLYPKSKAALLEYYLENLEAIEERLDKLNLEEDDESGNTLPAVPEGKIFGRKKRSIAGNNSYSEPDLQAALERNYI